MERDSVEVSRLLSGAAKAVASVRYCWLATAAKAGLCARPMGRIPNDVDEDEWLVRFITDRRSRKASDIKRAGKVAITFQNDGEDAYVALTGSAKVRERASEDRRLWKEAYNVYFPSDAERANAAFLEVDVERMDLWIRGVTPEPFGLRPTTLERSADKAWRLAP
jgi:general stress protein 26